jgi:hypothetical protein
MKRPTVKNSDPYQILSLEQVGKRCRSPRQLFGGGPSSVCWAEASAPVPRTSANPSKSGESTAAGARGKTLIKKRVIGQARRAARDELLHALKAGREQNALCKQSRTGRRHDG